MIIGVKSDEPTCIWIDKVHTGKGIAEDNIRSNRRPGLRRVTRDVELLTVINDRFLRGDKIGGACIRNHRGRSSPCFTGIIRGVDYGLRGIT